MPSTWQPRTSAESDVPQHPASVRRAPVAWPRDKLSKLGSSSAPSIARCPGAFAICLHDKIDVSRFSGPEQFYAGRPYISLQKSNVVFSTPNKIDADASIDRGAGNRSKTVEKIIAFAICLHEEIDASRFSGPEQFFACAPYIFFKKSNVVFRRRIDRCRCLDRSRCSKTIENGRKSHSVCYMSAVLRLFSLIVRFGVSFPHFQFHFTSRFRRSPLYGHPLLFHFSFFPSFFFSSLVPFLSFLFLPLL